MALRAGDLYHKGNVELNTLQEYFLTIGMAKVSTSAYEAYDTDILQKGKDIVVVNKHRQLAVAKQIARQIADQGYTQPMRRDRKSTRLNSSHVAISYAVFCLKKKSTNL